MFILQYSHSKRTLNMRMQGHENLYQQTNVLGDFKSLSSALHMQVWASASIQKKMCRLKYRMYSILCTYILYASTFYIIYLHFSCIFSDLYPPTDHYDYSKELPPHTVSNCLTLFFMSTLCACTKLNSYTSSTIYTVIIIILLV